MDKLNVLMRNVELLSLTQEQYDMFTDAVAVLEDRLASSEAALTAEQEAHTATKTVAAETAFILQKEAETHQIARQNAEDAAAVSERRREMAEAQLMNPITLRGGIPMQNDEGTDGELVYKESAVRESLRLSGYSVEGEQAEIGHEWASLPAQKMQKWGIYVPGLDAPIAGPLYSEDDARAEAYRYTQATGRPVTVKEMS